MKALSGLWNIDVKIREDHLQWAEQGRHKNLSQEFDIFPAFKGGEAKKDFIFLYLLTSFVVLPNATLNIFDQ